MINSQRPNQLIKKRKENSNSMKELRKILLLWLNISLLKSSLRKMKQLSKIQNQIHLLLSSSNIRPNKRNMLYRWIRWEWILRYLKKHLITLFRKLTTLEKSGSTRNIRCSWRISCNTFKKSMALNLSITTSRIRKEESSAPMKVK